MQWFPIPRWIEEEVKLPRYYKAEWNNFYNAVGNAKSVTSSFGLVTEVGRKTSSLVGTASTVFSDEDGDGFDETVTITIATTVTDEDELRIYYPDLQVSVLLKSKEE